MHISGGKFHNSYEKNILLSSLSPLHKSQLKSISFNMGNDICDKIFLYENLCIRKILETGLFFDSAVIK